MCAEAAEVQLASVCRYQRRQAEELLSPGATAQARLNISQSFLLSSSFSSSRLSISLSLPFPQHSSVSISVLGGILCSPPACLRLCWDDIHLVRRRFHCSTSHHLCRMQLHARVSDCECVSMVAGVAVSRRQDWLSELYLSGLCMFKGLMGSTSAVPSGHSTTGFYLGLNCARTYLTDSRGVGTLRFFWFGCPWGFLYCHKHFCQRFQNPSGVCICKCVALIKSSKFQTARLLCGLSSVFTHFNFPVTFVCKLNFLSMQNYIRKLGMFHSDVNYSDILPTDIWLSEARLHCTLLFVWRKSVAPSKQCIPCTGSIKSTQSEEVSSSSLL